MPCFYNLSAPSSERCGNESHSETYVWECFVYISTCSLLCSFVVRFVKVFYKSFCLQQRKVTLMMGTILICGYNDKSILIILILKINSSKFSFNNHGFISIENIADFPVPAMIFPFLSGYQVQLDSFWLTPRYMCQYCNLRVIVLCLSLI